jgi:ABC-type Fe3+ transport system permease subunit
MVSVVTLILWAFIAIILICAMVLNFNAAGKLDCDCSREKIKSARKIILWYAIITTVVVVVMTTLVIIIAVRGTSDAPSWAKTANRTTVAMCIVITGVASALAWWTYSTINSSGYDFMSDTYVPTPAVLDNLSTARKLARVTAILLLFSIVTAMMVFVAFGYSNSCKFDPQTLANNIAQEQYYPEIKPMFNDTMSDATSKTESVLSMLN